MSSQVRCVNCQELGGVYRSKGKNVCSYCGMSWNPTSRPNSFSGTQLMRRTGEKYGNYYETSLNSYRAYVTPIDT
jgi:hypothetical protein